MRDPALQLRHANPRNRKIHPVTCSSSSIRNLQGTPNAYPQDFLRLLATQKEKPLFGNPCNSPSVTPTNRSHHTKGSLFLCRAVWPGNWSSRYWALRNPQNHYPSQHPNLGEPLNALSFLFRLLLRWINPRIKKSPKTNFGLMA